MNATSGISPLALENRERSVEPGGSSPPPMPSPPPDYLTLLKAQRALSFCHHIPKLYLEMSKGLGRSGVVPVVVLKAPGVGEEQAPPLEPKRSRPDQ